MINIWGKYLRTNKIEKIDEASLEEATYLAAEYRLAYGRDWVIWVGRKKDEPTREPDERAHFRTY